ncbi:MAG: biopolymer transporter ExbD [Pirellulaceae bacterium]|jgi:biopolymer transport protein ExbD|nr:biopolymer transporter ExbD [Pirellulaceae bacterium]
MAVTLPKRSAISAVNLMPLIDCVFLLLIFFLVASRISDEEPQLDLDLPSISEALPAIFQPQELVVNIDAEGRIFVNGEFRQIEQVEQIMRQVQRSNPLTQAVVIRADRRTDWEHVATVLGLCKKVGIQQYSASIEPD